MASVKQKNGRFDGKNLAKIGLREDDIRHDVNGKPVKAIGELIDSLQNVPDDQPMLGIEHIRKGGMMDPIYTELNSPHSPGAPAVPLGKDVLAK